MRVREWMAGRIWMLLAFMLFFGVLNAGAGAPSAWILADHPDSIEQGCVRYRQIGKGNELLVSAKPGAKYSSIRFYPDLPVASNMVLRFEVRRNMATNQGISFAVSLTTGSGKNFWFSKEISDQWESLSYDFSDIKSIRGEGLLPGERIREVMLYARNLKQQADLNMDFSIRDLRFVIVSGGTVSKENVISYSKYPHFQWAWQEMETQLLQIARSPDFSGESLRTVRVAEPQYVPQKELAPGQWYWRYYMRSPLADRWSDTYRIHIPEKAHDFRLPEVDIKALERKEHPRLEGLALSRHAFNPPSEEWSNFVSSVKTPVPPDPQPRGKSSLSRIEWLGQIGDKIVGRTGIRLKNMGINLMETDDPELRALARERLMEVVAWNPEGASSPRADDLAAANVLIGMCWLFDALYPDLEPADREAAMDAIERRCTLFADAGVVPFALNPAQNHTFKKTEALGIGAMVLLGHRASADYWFKSACNIFAYRILPSMGFDGENQEGLSYWRYGGQMIADFADILQAFCGINLYEHPWLKKTAVFPVYCAPPGGFAVGFSDMHFYGNTYLRGPYLLYGADKYMERLTRKTGFACGAWYLGRSIPGSVKQRPPFDLDSSIHWKHIGWVLFNTCLPNGYENVEVGFHSGKYFAGHQHADQNHFVINAYGDKLAIDGGYYDWYGSPHYTAYSSRTLAHNTVLVNGKGQAWHKDGADGRIDGFYSSIPYDYAVGDASDPDIYRGELRLFRRKLLFIKPDYIVIHDQLSATEKPARFDWLIHSHTDAPMAFDPDSQTFSIARPLARLDGRFLFPENIKLKVAPSYTTMPSERRSNAALAKELVMPEWTLSATAKPADGSEEYFVVMRVSKAADDTPLAVVDKFETDAALGATLSEGGKVIQIVSRKAGHEEGLLKYGQLVTDADIACVEYSATGAVQRAFLGGGSRLEYGGIPVLQQDAPTNAHFDAGEEWGNRMLEPVPLIDGFPPFDAYCMQMGRGCLYMYSAEIDLPSNTVFSVDRSGIGDPVYVHVNGRISAVPDSGEILVEAGSWFMTVSSRSNLGHLRMAVRERKPRKEE